MIDPMLVEATTTCRLGSYVSMITHVLLFFQVQCTGHDWLYDDTIFVTSRKRYVDNLVGKCGILCVSNTAE